MTDVSMSQILDEIEKNTEFNFVYKVDDVNLNQKTNINVKEQHITKVLNKIFQNSKTTYNIIKNRIYLTQKTKKEKLLTEGFSQTFIIGKVSDENQQPLPGVNIFVKGTSKGTQSDFDGNYTLEASRGQTLVFSYMGMKTLEADIGESNTLNITMLQDAEQLREVVVTALGISRKEKALGYSITKIENLKKASTYNMVNALYGKVAGLNISQVASGTGGSSKVIIRGYSSLSGNNQPLYIIDGIPLNNDIKGEAGRWGGTDFGDGISSIDQDNIERISILKGPNAASLYGQRGSNGVILITTKTAKQRKGVGISLTNSFSIGQATVVPNFQNTFGQGLNGNFTHLRANNGTIYSTPEAASLGITGIPKMSAGRNRLTRGSWGAPFDGKLYEDQFGNILPYKAQPNTYQDYFKTEFTLKNGISLTGGNKEINYFLSYFNFNVDGYVPTNTIERNNFNLRLNANISPKLGLDAKVNYSIQDTKNRPELSDGASNPVYLLISQPRSMPSFVLSSYQWTEKEVSNALGVGSRAKVGNEKTYATNSSTANQYWTINKTKKNNKRNRILTSFNLNYNFNDNIDFTLRAGVDAYIEQRFRYRDIGTRRTSNQRGDIEETLSRVNDNNFEAFSQFRIAFLKDFNFNLNLGASLQTKFYRQIGFNGKRFKLPKLFTIENTEEISPIYYLEESETQSVFGIAQISFKEYLFLDITGRNDWSSTLPKKNNSFFYPSLSASFTVTDAFNIPKNYISFLKLRVSAAKAGSSGNPYQLTGFYSVNSTSYVGQPTATYTSTLVSPNLKNEVTTSFEIGTDIKLFKNRFEANFTYYTASTNNQILTVPISQTSNFKKYRINSGEITNKGIELLLKGTPLKSNSGLTWETSFNFAKNNNKVVSLASGIESFELGRDRGISVRAVPGRAFGELYGESFSWLKDSKGNILINSATGLPLRTDSKTSHRIGNALPTWTGGFSNILSYKGLLLSILFDISQGGQIYSQTTREEVIYGTTKKTIEGRNGTYIASGILAKQDDKGNWISTGIKNNIQVNAQDYWNVVASTKEDVVSEELLNDASYISMRELSLSYNFPSKLLSKTPFTKVGLTIYGRNLFYIEKHTDSFAPEASAFNTNNSSLGLESASLPLLRTFGINLNVEF
ncbi:MAG: SusC/RagA family TonB-linked outer membrane protein [Tenacibaculum sp.]